MAQKHDDKYTYRVTWSEEDGEYVGLCTEFPSLSWLANSQEAALKGIRKIVSEVVADMIANHDAFANSRCHPRMPLSGIHNFSNLQTGFPIRIASGMTNCERINHESVPEPIAIRQFSGKFMVRIPPEVHRHLALEAAEAGVSLNRLASAKLSQAA
jgi:predicted RNase H-like HicB family nuclease